MYITGACVGYFGQSGDIAYKPCVFRLKSAYATINTIMLAAIMSLIALFKLMYCVYMRKRLIAILSKSHYNRIKRVQVNALIFFMGWPKGASKNVRAALAQCHIYALLHSRCF